MYIQEISFDEHFLWYMESQLLRVFSTSNLVDLVNHINHEHLHVDRIINLPVIDRQYQAVGEDGDLTREIIYIYPRAFALGQRKYIIL